MRKMTLAGITLAVAVLAACGASNDTDTTGAVPAASEPESKSPTTLAPVTPASDPAFDPGARPLTTEFEPLEAGTYLVETTGVPMSFTLGDDWHVQPNRAARLVLSAAGSRGPGDRDLVFLRPTALADPATPNASLDVQTDWPVEDMEGWLANVIDGLIQGDPVQTSLGGLPALSFDVRLDPDVGCGPEVCVAFAGNRGLNGLGFDHDVDYRVWYVDAGDQPPLIVHAGAGDLGPYWFDDVQALLDTLAFGEPGPHPIPEGNLWELGYPSEVPAGEVTIPFGGGVSFELEDERFIFQDDGFVEIGLRLPGAIDMVLPQFTADGEPLESVDDVVAAMREWGLDLTEIEPTNVAGIPTRVFDLADGPQSFLDPVVTWDESARGWFPPTFARVWLLDSDRGVIMITAESFEADVALADALALAESILATFELVPAG